MSTQQKYTVVFALCLFYATCALPSVVAPALAAFGEMYPDASVTLIQQISTLPNLLAVPTAIIAGIVAGKKVSFKNLALLSCLMMGAGGVLPFFINESLYFVLACRAVYGLGYGILMSIQGTLIVRSFTGAYQAKVLGWGAMSLSALNIISPLAAGYMVNINPNLVYLIYLIPAICFFVMLFWFSEPEQIEDAPVQAEEKKQPASKPRITGAAWVVIFVFALTLIAYYPVFLGISGLVVEEGLGTAAQAGQILSVASVGSFAGGFVFAKYYDVTKALAVPMGIFMVAAGLALLAFGGLAVMYVGAFICGFAHIGIIMSSVYRLLGEILESGAVASANGMVGAFSNVGSFLAPFWMAFVALVAGTGSVRIAFCAGAVLLVVAGLVLIPVVKKAYATKVA